MRRVVVTGLGMVSPLGGDVETSWRNILASKSGAGPITRFDASDQKCMIACEVKPADHEYGFDPDKRVDYKIQRQVDPFIVYGLDAAGRDQDAGRWKARTAPARLLLIGRARRLPGSRARLCCTRKGRGGCRRTSCMAASSTSSRARSRSNTG